MNEARISAKLREALCKAGAKAMKVSDRFHASRPDLFVCYRGLWLVIETKIYPATPTTLQHHELTDFIAHKAAVFTATYNKKTKVLVLLDVAYGTSEHFLDFNKGAQWLLSQHHFLGTSKRLLN